jgi:hypothetical protein
MLCVHSMRVIDTWMCAQHACNDGVPFQAGSFPHTGALNEAGTGDGEGTSINLPIPGTFPLLSFLCNIYST